jgi:hypothetical protein
LFDCVLSSPPRPRPAGLPAAGRRQSLRAFSMKWKPVPTSVFVIAFLTILLAGPIVVYSFMLGGANAGIIAILTIVFFFVSMYIIVIRRYTE